jgi:hypothetical protein
MRAIIKWRIRAFKLFEKADAMGDLLNAPIDKYQKQCALYKEASIILQIIEDVEKDIKIFLYKEKK